jgi:hypothetical protein
MIFLSITHPSLVFSLDLLELGNELLLRDHPLLNQELSQGIDLNGVGNK